MDTKVSPRLSHLKPPRGGNDILRSVPDSYLKHLIGQTLELEAEEGDDERTTSRTQHHVTADDVHHEMKWRNLI